jgi:hypothetical protein
MIKTRLCDSKSRTQELRTKARNFQNKCQTNIYYANICKHEHKKNMKRLWCKIVLKTNGEQIEGNERSYFYLLLVT